MFNDKHLCWHGKKLVKVQETAAKVGLWNNIGIIKEMRVNTTYTQNFQVESIELENVKSFCYSMLKVHPFITTTTILYPAKHGISKPLTFKSWKFSQTDAFATFVAISDTSLSLTRTYGHTQTKHTCRQKFSKNLGCLWRVLRQDPDTITQRYCVCIANPQGSEGKADLLQPGEEIWASKYPRSKKIGVKSRG